MGGISIAILASLLLGTLAAPADTVPGETVLIWGRVRMANTLQGDPSQKTRIDSRKFEVIFRRRNGKTVSAQACLFSDLMSDRDWDGGCFPLTIQASDESIPRHAVSANELAPVDPPAQRLLRLLAAEAATQLPASRKVIGFDPEVPFTVQAERFLEADL